jgi:RNA polymerase sigma factor (sigma-70 family)
MADWPAVVEQNTDLVWRTAYRLLGNEQDAADCFQETFLAALRLARQQRIENWRALLSHLAARRAIDQLRRRIRGRSRTDTTCSPESLVAPQASPVQEAEADELITRLRRGLAELPTQQAEVLVLHCFSRLTDPMIATQMQIADSTVRVLLNRARRRLRDRMSPICRRDPPDDVFRVADEIPLDNESSSTRLAGSAKPSPSWKPSRRSRDRFEGSQQGPGDFGGAFCVGEGRSSACSLPLEPSASSSC